MSPSTHEFESAWNVIEKERRRDRVIRRTSVVAWTVTFVVLLVFAAIMVQRIAFVRQRVAAGIELPGALNDAAMPLVAVIGVLSLLIATLSTIGIFLRLRTASLSEIQLRLAGLEDMLRSEMGEMSGRLGPPTQPDR